ncbi:shikimate kinase [Cytobacillus firmus]|uniref:shikimate kinase n=1 Tax=Cytobacillus firmus TaxID=1399 RepID=UPI0030013DE1
MKPIYLIGFMGSGKTTIGKELAACLNHEVIDTDEEIVKRQNKNINDIFAQHGEGYFRNLESLILNEMDGRAGVITTGGGIVINPENRKRLSETGIVFFLYASPEEIFKRIEMDHSRPLLKGDKKRLIHELYEKRMPLYKETAHVIIDTTNKDKAEIIQEIIDCLE